MTPPRDSPSTLTNYDVHLFAVVRVKVADVAAESPQAAVAAACERTIPDLYARFEAPDGDYAEELSHYLVDVVGDAEFDQSVWFHAAGDPLLSLYRGLVAWDAAGRPDDVADGLVRDARGHLDCAV